jgi:hypothetical protein
MQVTILKYAKRSLHYAVRKDKSYTCKPSYDSLIFGLGYNIPSFCAKRFGSDPRHSQTKLIVPQEFT